MNKEKQIVIGCGEVGSAIQKVLECKAWDLKQKKLGSVPKAEVIHVCFPYSKDFTKQVVKYIKDCDASLVVVHSSVPIGTCDLFGWIHSPVRGVHPKLEEGVRTFVKYFGGKEAARGAFLFSERGVIVRILPEAKTTEAAKLWDTTQYGIMILLEKTLHKFCEENKLDFDVVYKEFNQTYNDGYMKLGMPHVVRPFLHHVDGPIGGHCVIPNAKLFRSKLCELLIEENLKF